MCGGADTVERAVADIAAGRAVVVVDDEDRENEGDIVFAAGAATPALVAFTVRHTSGYLCVALPGEECDRLALPLMCPAGGDGFGTAFTVTVDAARGVTTGISAADRAYTLRTLADARTTAKDLVRPGHVLPLRARDGGVLRRPGHTEAAVDLARLAGVAPTAALCEVVSDRRPGEMARLAELAAFAAEHDLTLVTIADLAAYRRRTEPKVVRAAAARLPTRFGVFTAYGYDSVVDDAEHMALVPAGDGAGADPGDPAPVAVHVECISGDVLGSRACDCGEELRSALRAVEAAGRGAIVYLRTARSTACPSRTASSQVPGESPYLIAAHILADLDVGPVRLLGAHPGTDGLAALGERGIAVVPAGTGNVRRLVGGHRSAPASDVRPAVVAATVSGA